MSILAPVSFWLLAFIIAYKRYSCWRIAVLIAATLSCLSLTFITELLSIFELLNYGCLLLSWLSLIAIISLFIIIRIKKTAQTAALTQPSDSKRMSPDTTERLLLISTAMIVVIIGLIAFLSPPNNWDSMTYHMSRVMHWIQNRDVGFYPTSILRQLHQNPFAEFAILHFQILSGGEFFANSVQWVSMIGCLIGSSLIAKEFGLTLYGQIFSSLFCLTLPMGILQASSTQNDYVTAFHIICFILFGMKTFLRESDDHLLLYAAAGSLGLAILTKATAYLYVFPFLCWFVFKGIIRSPRNVIKPALVIVIIVLIANIGHYWRNNTLYGFPLGPMQESHEYKYLNETISLEGLVSNSLKNLALHAGTPSRQLNAFMETTLRGFHHLLNIQIDDPRFNIHGSEFHIPYLSNNENLAGNPLHLFLIIAALLICCITNKNKMFNRDVLACFCLLILSFLLFCLFVKWQPWNSRLHLPLFVISSPIAAYILFSKVSRKGANLIAVLLLLTSLPWLLVNGSRPLLFTIGRNPNGSVYFSRANIMNTPRTEQYFVNNPNLMDSYQKTADFISSTGCNEVGLHLGPDNWEYPFWVLIQRKKLPLLRIEHVGVDNVSRSFEAADRFKEFEPCAIISLAGDNARELLIKGYPYQNVWKSGPVSIMMRDE